MLARIFVTVGGLIVLALVAALVGPYFIDWTGYRASFEREASNIVGRQVKVKGEASARLLPFPSVTFTDVEIGGGEDGAPVTTVEEFSMDAELAPFLSGEILIFDMRLVRPSTVAWIDADGKFNWAIDPHAPVSPSSVSLERMTITDGQVRLVVQGVPDRTLSEVNVVAAARSLSGPWRAEGTLKANGHPFAVNVSTGIAATDGMRVKLRAEPEGSLLGYDLDGNVTSKNGVLAYSGDYRIARKPTPLDGLRDGDGRQVAPDGPGNRMAGKFTLTDKRLAVSEFRFETGPLTDPYVATGTAAIEFGRSPSFEVKATGAQVRLGSDVASGTAQETLASRLEQLEKAVLALPAVQMPGNVDVELPAVVAGDTTIRDVRLAATTREGSWEVSKLTASLPGRTTLEARGVLNAGDQPGFKGRLVLAVGQPSGFANWLARDIDAPVRRLSRGGFSADVTLTRRGQKFEALELALGAARFTGQAERIATPGAKPVLNVKLQGAAVSSVEMAALASMMFSDKGALRLDGHELTFAAKAGPVGDKPLAAGGLDLAIRVAGENVEIDRLSVSDLAGASIAATGRLEAMTSAPQVSVDATVVSTDLAPLAGLFGSATGNRLAAQLSRNAAAYPDLLKDAQIDILAKAGGKDGRDRLSLEFKGIAGGGDVSGLVAMAGQRAKPLDAAMEIGLRVANPDATGLLALAGVPVLPLRLVGEAEANLSAKGTLGKGLQSSLGIKGKEATGTFIGTFSAPVEGFQARGKISLEATDVEPWLMSAGLAFPGMGTGLASSLSAEIDYAGNMLMLDKIAGTVAENAISGELNIEEREAAPVVSGQLALDELSLEPLAQMVLGAQAFDSAEEGWPTQTFQQMVASPFFADVDINAATLSIGSGLSAHDAALSLKLDDEGLHIPKLEARLGNGKISGLFDLRNNASTGLFSGQFKLDGAKVENLLPTLGVADPKLSGGIELSGALTGSGKTVGAVMASLAGSGTMALKGVEVSGVDGQAFGALIKAADVAGRDIDLAKVAGFAPGLIRTGKFAAGDAEASFTVAGGVARLAPVKFGQGPMQMSADMKLDLSTLTAESVGTLAYAPGDEALVGSQPDVGIVVAGKLDALALTLDTQPLAQFLTQRALEIEQARVEQMQAVLLEKQRLRRETRFYAALETDRRRAAEAQRQAEREAEAARLKAAEEARLKAEEEARIRAEEVARAVEDAEARKKAEADAVGQRVQAEADEKRRAEAEARQREAAEARRRAEAEARRKAELAEQRRQANPPERRQNPPRQQPAPQRPAAPAPTTPGLF